MVQLQTVKNANDLTYTCMQMSSSYEIPQDIISATALTVHSYTMSLDVPTVVSNLGNAFCDTDIRDTNLLVDNTDIQLTFGDFVSATYGNFKGFQFLQLLPSARTIMTDGFVLANPNALRFYCSIILDEENQRGYLILLEDLYRHPTPSYYMYCIGGVVDGHDYIWEVFSGQIPQSYQWQSVPSISGKNGILQSLVQIKEEAINDGEPVSEATVLSFDSLGNINIPSVIDEQMPVDPSDVTSVTATYLIPALENGTYEGIKLLVKKDSIPTSEQDADKVVNLDEPTSILRIDSKSVGNLDEDSHYYFMVKLIDEVGTEATSDPKDIWTSHSEGWTFDYTGSIQTFVAPKTGIYQLETWGAQGGNATDGTNSARGGYGAYAYGEVLLTQGDTLYINVGGQNGYGGGGDMSLEIPLESIVKNLDMSHYKSASGWNALNNLSQWYGTDWNLFGELEHCNNPQATRTESEYYLNAGDNRLDGGCMRYALSLNSVYKVSKIECDIKMMGTSNSQYYTTQVELRKSETNELTLSGMLGVVHNSSAGSMDYNVTDNNYHTYIKEFSTPIELDYLVLYQAYYPAYFKNIKLTIVS